VNPYVLAVTGASAQPIAQKCIELLLQNKKSFHLILSKGAYKVWESEMNIVIPKDEKAQENFWRERLNINTGNIICHNYNKNSAPIASGSYKTNGMLIVPCSMGTVGRITSGISTNLIERCADVHIKESRPLIISPRESPLSLIHLKNLTELSQAGVKIIPPMPAWYSNPKSIDDLITFIVARIFDSLNEDLININRWQG
tara:strand:+ start:252 stop:851 length:600 start_codon:yes stop_codon:yes gene_type:complete